MKIVKPYGRSETIAAANTPPEKRTLRLKDQTLADPSTFAHEDPKLLIAQWISALDKVLSKPKPNKKPFLEAYNIRQALGEALWHRFIKLDAMSNISEKKQEELKHIWFCKVHPYTPRKEILENKTPSLISYKKLLKDDAFCKELQNKWFADFSDGKKCLNLNDNDFLQIAKKIEHHLNTRAFKICGQGEARPFGKGVISDRAESIENNYATAERVQSHIKAAAFKLDKSYFEFADKADKDDSYDIIEHIHTRISNAKYGKKGAYYDAIKELTQYYEKVFVLDGAVLTYTQINKLAETEGKWGRLLRTHQEIKKVYRRLLIETKTKKNAKDIVPASKEAMCAFFDNIQKNKLENAYIRLGKVIHYQRLADIEAHENQNTELPEEVKQYWPSQQAVQNSIFWSSEGQHAIKRNEAFVRVWRNIVILMSRNLKNWIDPENEAEHFFYEKDFLLTEKMQYLLGVAAAEATEEDRLTSGGQQVDPEKREKFLSFYNNKLKYLFGGFEENLKTDDPDFARAVWWHAMAGLFQVRNAAIHFKSRTEFIASFDPEPAYSKIERSSNTSNSLVGRLDKKDDAFAKLRTLFINDYQQQGPRLQQTLAGVGAGQYLTGDELARVCNLLKDSLHVEPELSLPRFGKMIERLDNLQGKKPKLIPAYNRAAFEADQSKLCQYTLLKLLYESPFKVWLQQQGFEQIQRWGDQALERTKQQAEIINKDSGLEARASVVMEYFKGAKNSKQQHSSAIDTLMQQLSHLVNSEHRVQNGYENDPDKARENSTFLEEFKCDVLAHAFEAYLDDNEVYFICEITSKGRQHFEPADAIPDFKVEDIEPENWQVQLYFLLHLCPVDDVGKLLNQMRKWSILARTDQTGHAEDEPKKMAQFRKCMTLYLDMHDNKFVGLDSFYASDDFKNLFDKQLHNDSDFSDWLQMTAASQPAQAQPDGSGQVTYIPRRGLREIIRFGDWQVIQAILKKSNEEFGISAYITKQDFKDWKELHGKVADAQKRREQRHKKFTRNGLSDDELRQYMHALKSITKHRLLSNRISMTDLVRLHRTLGLIFGRLVDFSGLWERDLYFRTLALIHSEGYRENREFTPNDVFKNKGLEELSDGNAQNALGKILHVAKSNYECLIKKMTTGPLENKDQRNKIAHLEALNYQSGQLALFKDGRNLTSLINDARKLMSYDRKLKNAVSKSMIQLLEREGIELKWTMENHKLVSGEDKNGETAKLSSKMAIHLNKGRNKIKLDHPDRQSLRIKDENNYSGFFISEEMIDEAFLRACAVLFGGKVDNIQKISVHRLDDEDIDQIKKFRKQELKGNSKSNKGHGHQNSSRKNRGYQKGSNRR